MKRWTTSFLLVALACTFGLLGGGIVMYLRSAEASRNSAGTYSLASSPVTTLQTISTSLWNNTFADLATGVTDSLDRNGRGGMLAALRGIDGTVASPAFSYTSETGSGEYRIGAGDLGWAILGGKKLELTGSLFTVTPAASFSSTFALADLLTQTIAGTASTTPYSALEASLADGNSVFLALGKAIGANTNGYLTYTKNATAANSTFCLGINGASNALCTDGNNKTAVGGALTVAGATTLGSSGTAISNSIRGTASLTPGSVPSLSCLNANITVTGAAAGADCAVGAISTLQGVFATGCIVTANTCAINVCNVSAAAVTPPTGTYACRVFNP